MNAIDHLTSWRSDWSEVRVVVYGLGKSGFSAADTLNELGAKLLVVADAADDQTIDILNVLGIEYLVGANEQTVATKVSEFGPNVLLTSPGVRPNNFLILTAQNAGIKIWTDIDLAWRIRDKFGAASKWICITGTNGKTTVTQLVEAMLIEAGVKAVACGNIGTPILDVVRDPAEFEVLVVEMSSFQLHYSGSIEPVSSAVLNLAEDHLDWHGSMEAYGKAKGKIYDNTKICCVYSVGDKVTTELLRKLVTLTLPRQLVSQLTLQHQMKLAGWKIFSLTGHSLMIQGLH